MLLLNKYFGVERLHCIVDYFPITAQTPVFYCLLRACCCSISQENAGPCLLLLLTVRLLFLCINVCLSIKSHSFVVLTRYTRRSKNSESAFNKAHKGSLTTTRCTAVSVKRGAMCIAGTRTTTHTRTHNLTTSEVSLGI